MSCSKPLSYSNYEPIILNMAADQRIRFALHCSAVQTIEKLVPLKTKFLVLNPLKCQINNASYDIDFLRWNHLSKTSQLVTNIVDRTMGFHQRKRIIEAFLKQDEFHSSQEKNHESKLLEVQEELDMIRPLDHTDYLQFSETNKKVILLEHTRSAHDTVEHLLQQLFGNREVIYVKELQISSHGMIGGLRLPLDFVLLEKFNFRINNLNLVKKLFKVDSSALQKVQRLTVFFMLSHREMQKLEVKHVHFMNNLIEFWYFASEWTGGKSLTRWTCYFGFSDRDFVHVVFKHLAHKHGVTPSENPGTSGTEFPQRVVIPSKIATSEMHVYCEYTKEYGWSLVLEFVSK